MQNPALEPTLIACPRCDGKGCGPCNYSGQVPENPEERYDWDGPEYDREEERDRENDDD